MNSARRCGKGISGLVLLLALTLCLFGFAGCGNGHTEAPASTLNAPTTATPAETRVETRPQQQTELQTEPLPEETREENLTLKLTIDGTELDVLWEDNESAAALRDLAADAPLTIQMSPYGGFEQVGPIGRSLPRNDVQTTTEPGDIVLYSGNQIVVFYGSNSWAYTRLGKIQGMDQAALTELLGNGAVTLALSVGPETADYRIPDILLNSGYTMPVIGLGTWTLNDEEAENSVYHALKCGMRLIDTARYYGNEVGVGRGLKRAIDEGIVTREEVFLTSKIYGGNYERAGGIIDSALSDLNVDYIDLLLIHQPGADDEGVYKAMEEAVEAGKLRSIGISNYYTPEAVDEVLAFAEITPAVIQNENHLYYQNAALQEYVKKYGIVVESWYPFGGRGHTQEHFNNEVILDLAKNTERAPHRSSFAGMSKPVTSQSPVPPIRTTSPRTTTSLTSA